MIQQPFWENTSSILIKIPLNLRRKIYFQKCNNIDHTLTSTLKLKNSNNGYTCLFNKS